MRYDVITGSLAELLGGLAVILTLGVAARARRRRTARPGGDAAGAGPAGRPARTYTLIGTRAPDGHPVRIASGRAAGTVITRQEGRSRRRFELTDAVLSDGTYAAEPLDGYR